MEVSIEFFRFCSCAWHHGRSRAKETNNKGLGFRCNRNPTAAGFARLTGERTPRGVLMSLPDRDSRGKPGRRGPRATAGNLIVDYPLAWPQDRDLMRRGRHSIHRECGSSRQRLLSMGWSQRRKLVRSNRKTHDFISWKFRSCDSDSVSHRESCGGCDRQSIPQGDSPFVEMAKRGLLNASLPTALAQAPYQRVKCLGRNPL